MAANSAKGKKQLIGIVAKPSNTRAQELTRVLIDFLTSEQLPFLVDNLIGHEIGMDRLQPELLVPREALSKKAEIIVVLGGDGTLISVSRYPADPPPIVIGVNVGKLGFLTEITVDEMIPVLKNVLAGKASVEKHSMLSACVNRKGKEIHRYNAVNDIVITKEALARIFELDLYVNNQAATLVRGDGIIIATPGGSTAYSLSAGGSIVHPQVDAILVTPICPHTLTSRPLVIPGKSEIRCVISKDLSGEGDSRVYLTIDGQEGMALVASDEVLITTASQQACFAKSPSKNYFEILGAKLKWAHH